MTPSPPPPPPPPPPPVEAHSCYTWSSATRDSWPIHPVSRSQHAMRTKDILSNTVCYIFKLSATIPQLWSHMHMGSSREIHSNQPTAAWEIHDVMGKTSIMLYKLLKYFYNLSVRSTCHPEVSRCHPLTWDLTMKIRRYLSCRLMESKEVLIVMS